MRPLANAVSALACLIATACATTVPVDATPLSSAAPTPLTAAPGESPELLQRLAGTLITVQPVGGIVALDLATRLPTTLRPANAGLKAVHSLSEPDLQGSLLFITEREGWGRGFAVHQFTPPATTRVLFQGPGDPLWDHAIAPVTLAPRGGLAAFVTQPESRQGERFRPLLQGPLQLWDPARSGIRDLGVVALGERPAWFPDGQRLAYAAREDATATATPAQPGSAAAAEVRILDLANGIDRRLAPGHLPIVSSDGASVLVTRGRSFDLILVDVRSGAEQPVRRRHGLGTPLALVASRYLIYRGQPTPGAPTGLTEHNSNWVGPKPMQAIKVMDLRTGEFATVLPLIDPRSEVTVLAALREPATR